MQAPSIDPTIIAALGAMQGTLGGQTSLQAQQDQEQQGVVDQANQAAQAAGQAYQSAAGQPTPDLGSMAALIPTLFGNTASVLSGNPDFARHGHETVVQRQKDLADARLSNLQALRDQFDQKARAAEQLGNTEMANEARMKQEQFSKAMQAILQQQQSDLTGKREKDLETQRQAGRKEIQGMKDAASAAKAQKDQADYFDSLTDQTKSGNTWLDSTNVPPKDKHQMMIYAKQNNLMVADKGTADRIRAAQEVNDNFDQMDQVMARFLANTTDPTARLKTSVGNLWAQATQSNPDIASWGNTQLAAIRNIQALASGIGSGFRLNEQEIKRAVSNFPKLTDNLPTARRKLQWERDFLLAKEKAFFGKRWQPPAGTSVDTGKTTTASMPSSVHYTPEIKAQAMKMARTEDYSGLAKLVEKYPELDEDPDLNALTSENE